MADASCKSSGWVAVGGNGLERVLLRVVRHWRSGSISSGVCSEFGLSDSAIAIEGLFEVVVSWLSELAREKLGPFHLNSRSPPSSD